MRIASIIALSAVLGSFTHSVAAAEAGAEKAVVEVSGEKGLRLSAKAEKTLGIETKVVFGPGVTVPHEALIRSLEKVSVYRLRKGFYKLIDAKVVSKTDASSAVTAGGLVKGDRVVVLGAPLLRVAEMEAVNPGE
jgi:hypothetical protein